MVKLFILHLNLIVMLNITHKSIDSKIDKTRYSIFQRLDERSISQTLLRLLCVVAIVGVLSLFLPWTQNIRAKGYVSALNPYDKPQAIQSLIDGRIVNWYVQEGALVNAGDTILRIEESKEAYLDPEILSRTRSQIDAKQESVNAYKSKVLNLKEQAAAIQQNRDVKLEQNEIKINQVKLKIQSDSLALVAADIDRQNSKKQYDRTNELYQKGIKSLTEVELKDLKWQKAQAKYLDIQNKITNYQNDIDNLKANAFSIKNEVNEKLAKINSDIQSTNSLQYNSLGDVNKLESQFNQYEVRSNAYFITSPIRGTITRALRIGIGEFIKAGEDLITIIPEEYELAVEMYVRPVDMPLMKKGQQVRIMFDGWPALIFAGWPDNSYGTFSGEVFAIDKFISKNGMYRILVVESDKLQKWPEQLRIGGGANALVLLNKVRLYYEVWRQLNGFPSDYYQYEIKADKKLKAPIKKIK